MYSIMDCSVYTTSVLVQYENELSDFTYLIMRLPSPELYIRYMKYSCFVFRVSLFEYYNTQKYIWKGLAKYTGTRKYIKKQLSKK